MSLELRNALIDTLIAEQPALRVTITEQPNCLIAGNWDLVAFSYQHAFEALWDFARGPEFGLAELPLLMLWRHSVELTIKSALRETTGSLPPGHHRLTELFDDLIKARADIGMIQDEDDEFTSLVRSTIEEFQLIDERADRFRYPTSRQGVPHDGISVDLDRLLQAHWLITNWCDAASIEAEQLKMHGR